MLIDEGPSMFLFKKLNINLIFFSLLLIVPKTSISLETSRNNTVADVAKCQSVLDKISKRAKESQSDAVFISQNQQLIFKMVSKNGKTPIQVMSVTKSIVSLGMGFLYDEKKIKLDDPVYKFYPEWKQGRKKYITIRQLLTHTSGLQAEVSPIKDVESAPDFVKLALTAELVTKPGSTFFYNNKAINLLAGIISKVSGLPMDSYINKKLFIPLGIRKFFWYHDAVGNPAGMGGLSIKGEDLLKIGELILNHGKWNNKQIISNAWIKLSMTPYVYPPHLKNTAYGLLWWLSTKKPYYYAALGDYGQQLVIIPSNKVVAVRQILAPQAENSTVDSFDDFRKLLTALLSSCKHSLI